MYDSNPFNISLTNFLNYSPYYYQMTKMGECKKKWCQYNEEDTYSYPCSGPEHHILNGEVGQMVICMIQRELKP